MNIKINDGWKARTIDIKDIASIGTNMGNNPVITLTNGERIIPQYNHTELYAAIKHASKPSHLRKRKPKRLVRI